MCWNKYADVSLLDTAMAIRFSWETIPELGSDPFPLLLIWDKDNKVEQIELFSTNSSIAVFMRCCQSGPCQNVWWSSVAYLKGPSERPSPSRQSSKVRSRG